jgi:hypothetical protein
VLQQGHGADRDHRGAGLVAAVEQQADQVDELTAVVETGLVEPDHDAADQVLARFLELLLEQPGQVAVELGDRGHPDLGGRLAAEQLVGAVVQVVVVLVRDSEDLAHDRQRHRQRQRGDQVDHRPLLEHRVDPLVDDLLDARQHRANALLGELTRDGGHPAVGRVLGRVPSDERALGAELRRNVDVVRETLVAAVGAGVRLGEELAHVLVACDHVRLTTGAELDLGDGVLRPELRVFLRGLERTLPVPRERRQLCLGVGHGGFPSRQPRSTVSFPRGDGLDVRSTAVKGPSRYRR